MKILGIESSCDETAASVVENGQKLLSNVVASSLELHREYGGVVPEIAARSHIESITPVINQALIEAKYGQGVGLDEVQENEQKRTNRTGSTESESRPKLTQQFAKSKGEISGSAGRQAFATDALWDDIDGIAVTHGPGLGGSLLVGLLSARTLAIVKNKPLFPVNHVQAHVLASFLTGGMDGYKYSANAPAFPLLALIVSGGHTQLVLFENPLKYRVLGRTHDDAVGEAFDKVAKILGLPYPGGPSISKMAAEFKGEPIRLPLPRTDDKYGFSYSGLKTAVLRAAQQLVGADHSLPSYLLPDKLSDANKGAIAASFQDKAVEILLKKLHLAEEEFAPSSIVICGGVAANQLLASQAKTRLKTPLFIPDPKLCTDNGAMIATLGCYLYDKNLLADPYKLNIAPALSM